MKILIASDSPFHTTGYGNLSRSLARRMAADGHQPLIFSPGGLYGIDPVTIDGITVLGAAWNDDRCGSNTIRHHIARQNPDLLITLLDAQGLQAYGWDPVPWIAWAPVDSWPLSKQEVGQLGRATRVLVPSKWGYRVAMDAGLACEYLPYGIEAADFAFSQEGRERFRTLIGVDEQTFLIGMVGLNYGMPDRKGFGWAFEAVAELASKHANVKAWCQTDPSAGLDLLALRDVVGANAVIGLPKAPPTGSLPTAAIRDMYSAFDCFLMASTTEGFGLPVVEAQANGCPVVLNAATALTELCGPGGMQAQPAGHSWITPGTRISVPDVAELVRGLETQYERWKACGSREPEVAHDRMRWARAFDWNALYEHRWRPILSTHYQRIEPEKTAQRKLQLGCGNTPHEGFVHHDRVKHAEFVDVAHDLTDFPWPWENEEFDYVVVEDVLEHLRGDLPAIFDELWRILAPGGWLFIRTCEAGSWMHAYDPTHLRGFSLESFDYWDPDTRAGRVYGMETGDRKWRIVRRSLHGGGEIEVLMQPRKEAAHVYGRVGTQELAQV